MKKTLTLILLLGGLFCFAQTTETQLKLAPVPQTEQTQSDCDEGLLMTNWTQSQPYNMFCPMDPTTGSRSYAGCPAVAMAQIINHLQTTNGTRFDDGDDYYHYYPGRLYFIDDDYETIGFLPFTQLNNYLDVIDSLYSVGMPLGKNEAAALVWACGVACRQVYTSSVSGTVSVQQAYDAYLRFGFDSCVLVTEADSAMYAMLDENLDRGIPAHLAVESPDGQTGHNVVVDGRRDDGKYHINFGFGGQLDGWYSIPDADFPYGMSCLEGIILNLVLSEPLSVNENSQTTNTLNVYPNPARGFIRVEGTENDVVGIYDLMGRLVFETTSKTINIGELGQGLYMIKSNDKSAKLIVK